MSASATTHAYGSLKKKKRGPEGWRCEERERDEETNLHHRGHYLEIIDIKRRRQRIDKDGLLARRITKRMRRPRTNNDIIALLRINIQIIILLILTMRKSYILPLEIPNASPMEPDRALRNEERLVVHLMPVGHGAGGVGFERELDHTEAVVGVGAVVHDAADERVADADDFAGAGGDEGDGFFGGDESGHFRWLVWIGKDMVCYWNVCGFFRYDWVWGWKGRYSVCL